MNGTSRFFERQLRGPRTSRWLQCFGINSVHYWILIDLFGTLSERREVFSQLGRDGLEVDKRRTDRDVNLGERLGPGDDFRGQRHAGCMIQVHFPIAGDQRTSHAHSLRTVVAAVPPGVVFG